MTIYFRGNKNQIFIEQYNPIIDYQKLIIVFNSQWSFNDVKVIECLMALSNRNIHFKRIYITTNYIGNVLTLEIGGFQGDINTFKTFITSEILALNKGYFNELLNRLSNDWKKVRENSILNYLYVNFPQVLHIVRDEDKFYTGGDTNRKKARLLEMIEGADYYLFSMSTKLNTCEMMQIKEEDINFEIIKKHISNPIYNFNVKLDKPKVDICNNQVFFALGLPENYYKLLDYYSLVNYILGVSHTNILLKTFRWREPLSYKSFSNFMYSNGLIIGVIYTNEQIWNISKEDFWKLLAEAFEDITQSDFDFYLKEKVLYEQIKDASIDSQIQRLFRRTYYDYADIKLGENIDYRKRMQTEFVSLLVR